MLHCMPASEIVAGLYGTVGFQSGFYGDTRYLLLRAMPINHAEMLFYKL